MEDPNALILLFESDDSKKTWQSWLRRAVYRASVILVYIPRDGFFFFKSVLILRSLRCKIPKAKITFSYGLHCLFLDYWDSLVIHRFFDY